MVTKKRKIETEQDRFGGFDEKIANERSIFRSYETIQVPDEGRVFGRTTSRLNGQIYSGRIPSEPAIQTEHKRPVKSTPLSEEDLMPSIKTMAYAEQKKKTESRESLERKTKIMLAVYMIIVVLLAAIVIGTGVAINSTSASITSLDADILKAQETILTQEINLAKAEDPYRISGIAQDENGLNMDEANIAAFEEIELIPLNPVAPPAKKTNAFDKFCEFLRRLLGN